MNKIDLALSSVRVSDKGLPANEPERGWALRRRQSRRRAFLMAQEWLRSEDRSEALVAIADRWGYSKVGACERMIKRALTGEFAVDAPLSVRLNALREMKRHEVMEDSIRRRSELDNQVAEVRGTLRAGESWVDFEYTDDDGKIKVRRRSAKVLLRELLAEIERSHIDESNALSLYLSKPAQKVEVDLRNDVRKRANEEFVEMFDRAESQERVEVAVNAEVVDE